MKIIQFISLHARGYPKKTHTFALDWNFVLWPDKVAAKVRHPNPLREL